MTLEQPSLGPRGLGVAPPSTLLLYHPSTSKRLRPRAEVKGILPAPHPLPIHQPVGTWSLRHGQRCEH